MEKLNRLVELCKCGVHLTINGHTDYYQTVQQYFEDNPSNMGELDDIDSDIYDKMKELNTVIELQFYPDTPVGFYRVTHYDLESAVAAALTILKQ